MFLLGSGAICSAAHAEDSNQIWPTKEWRTSSPEEQGMDSAALAQLVDFGATHEFDSVLVVRHGQIVAEAYYAPFKAGVKHRINSATKSLVGALVAIALKDGLLDSVNHRVLDFFADRTIASVDDNKKAITIQNLLDMTSGLAWSEPLDEGLPKSMFEMERSQDWTQYILDRPVVETPGAAFHYNSGNPHLLSAILGKLTGGSALDYAQKHVFQPLGISDIIWRHDPQGHSIGGYGLYLQPRDMAKIGYLYLRNGLWDGTRIFPASWIEQVTHASVLMNLKGPLNLRYANLFWVVPEKNAYLANGFHGQRIIVMPALDIVAVMTGTGHSGSIRKEIDLIADAVKSDSPAPPNPAAQEQLAARVREAATEHETPIGAIPEIAKTIAGKVYRFPDNVLGLNLLSLNASSVDASFVYETHAGSGAAPVERFEGPIGLDGVYRTGAPTGHGITAAKGRWIDDQSFVAEFQELGADDARKATFTFDGKSVVVSFENSFGGRTELHGETSD